MSKLDIHIITQKDLIEAGCFNIPEAVKIARDAFLLRAKNLLIFPDKVSLVFDQEEKTYSDYILDWIISGLSIEFIIDNFTVILQTMLIAIESEPYMSKKINTLLKKIILYHKNSKQVIREKIVNKIGNEKYKEINCNL